MSSKLKAMIVVISALAAAGVSYCAYGEWRERRLASISEGMSATQVREIAGDPDTEGPITTPVFACDRPDAAVSWRYHVIGNHYTEFVFDRRSKLICRSDYYVWT